MRKVSVFGTILCSLLMPTSLWCMQSSEYTDQEFEKGVQAVTWSFPLFKMMSAFEFFTHPAICQKQCRGAAPIGQFYHAQCLMNHTHRVVTNPNNDTWYESAWLNVKDMHYVLTIPPIDRNRYYSFTIYDAWTNVQKVIDSRTQTDQAQAIIIAGPSFQPSDEQKPFTTVVSPTPIVWVLGRILAKNQDDMRAIQQNLILKSEGNPSISEPQSPTTNFAEPLAFFARIGRYLAICPGPENKRNLLEWFKKVGCTVQGLQQEALTPELVRVHTEALKRMEAAFFKHGKVVNGWATNADCGNVIDDNALRGGLAHKALGALTTSEAVYFRGNKDSEGHELTGENRYKIHFEVGQLPSVDADGFWSLSLYGPDNYFIKNPLDRFSIGDRISSFIINDDGSADIIIQHVPEQSEQSDSSLAKVLPAPEGKFYLILRLYHASEKVHSGEWQPPLVHKIAE